MKVSIASSSNAILLLMLICTFAIDAQANPASEGAVPNTLEPGEAILLPVWLRQLSGTITFEAEAVDIEELELTDVRLPISLNGDRIEMTGGSATSGPGTIGIGGSYDFSNNDTQIRISGESLSFDDDDEIPTPAGLIFDNENLLPDWLRIVDGRLTFDLDLVIIDEMQVRTVKGPVVFTDVGFNADLDATLGGGTLSLHIRHLYDGVTTSIKVNASDVSLGVMRLTKDYIKDAPTSFTIDLAGEGATERTFVSTMDGFIEVEIGEGKIINTEIDKLAQNIFALSFTSILPLKKTATRANLECGAVRLDFDDGLAQSKHFVVVRSDKLAIIGRGVVDFSKETLDIHLKPHVRQGIKTKTGGAVSLISVKGPMDAPKLTVKAGGLLTEGLSLGAAFATFGLSKVAEMVFDWGTRADIACEIAVDN